MPRSIPSTCDPLAQDFFQLHPQGISPSWNASSENFLVHVNITLLNKWMFVLVKKTSRWRGLRIIYFCLFNILLFPSLFLWDFPSGWNLPIGSPWFVAVCRWPQVPQAKFSYDLSPVEVVISYSRRRRSFGESALKENRRRHWRFSIWAVKTPLVV